MDGGKENKNKTKAIMLCSLFTELKVKLNHGTQRNRGDTEEN